MNEREEKIPAVSEDAAGSRRRWRRFLLIWLAALLLAGAVLCLVLYRYLEVYEITRPELVMDEYMRSVSAAEWREDVRRGLAEQLSALDDGESLYEEYAAALLQSEEFTYRKDPAAAGDKLAYLVRCGGRDISRVILVPAPGEKPRFGLHRYVVEGREPCELLKGLEAVTVEVDAPTDAEIYINGKRLDEYYIAELSVPCPNMSELESRFDVVPHFVRYRVDAMYGAIRVTDGAGRELRPDASSEKGIAHYTCETERYSVTVTAPEDVCVTVNGALLGAEDVTRRDRAVLKGLEDYIGGVGYDTCTYALEELYSVPRVSAASADGQTLTPVFGADGNMTFFHPQNDALRDAQLELVQQFFRAYIDYGAHPFLGSQYITREMVYDLESGIDESTRVSMRRYYNLLDRILPGTELYNYVQNSTDAMIWASNTAVDMSELTFTDFAYVSEDCFTCTVRYKADFAATAWYENYTYEMQNAYEIAFVRSEWGTWYAAAMSAVN